MRAYDAIIRAVESYGIETVFTLMSEGIMEMLSTAEARGELDVVKARHEQAAIAMADGYARAGDGIGVCIIGRGPAIAQAGTALTTAQKKGSDIIVITPEPALSDEYDIKAFDQEAFLRSTIGTVVSLRDPDTVHDSFQDAIRRVTAGDGPLAVQVPKDVLKSEVRTPSGNGQRRYRSTPSERSQGRVHPDEECITGVANMYLNSDLTQPPAILAGRGAMSADAKESIEALAERIGAALVTSLQSRHYFSGHPQYLGFVGGWGSDTANQVLSDADLVFVFGASLNPFTTDEESLFDDATRIIQVDTDRTAIGRYLDIDQGIWGDARITADAIEAELDRRGIAEGRDRLEAAITDISSTGEPEFSSVQGTMDPREVVDVLDNVLPGDRRIVTDLGQFAYWIYDRLYADPENVTFSGDFASIGLGLPMGIGTAVAAKECPCVTICGDAGFMMSLQELETAVRNEVPLTVVVMNDDSLGAEYHFLEEKGEDPDAARVPAPDFADVATAFGADGYTARDREELESIGQVVGQQTDGPVVVDCKTNFKVTH